MDRIEIGFDKTTTAVYFAGSLVFALIAALVLFLGIVNPVSLIGLVMFFALLLFGSGSSLFLLRLVGSKPALVIEEKGITNHTTWAGVGLIRWQDISEIKFDNSRKRTTLGINVNSPLDYINRVTPSFRRSLLRLSLRYFGTLEVVNAEALAIEKEEFLAILRRVLDEHRIRLA